MVVEVYRTIGSREVEQGLEVKNDEKKKWQQPGFVRLEATSIIARKAIRADLYIFDLSDFQRFISLGIEHTSVGNLAFASGYSAVTSAEATNTGSTWLAHNTYLAIMSTIQGR